MARPLEPITAAKALEALADNSRSTHPAERLIIPVIPRDSTMGPIPHVEAQALMRGMDWENNCMILTPAQPLTVLTPDEVRDIQLSMRQGGNWHSYQRHQKQQDKIDLLEARQDTAITESNTKSDAALAGVVGNGVALTNETNDRKAADQQHDAALADHDLRITSNTNSLATKVNQADFAVDQQRQDSALAAETSTRSSQFTTLSAGVKQAQDTGAYAQSRADAAYAHSEANRQALDATNKRVAQNTADIANHEQRIQGLESQTNSKFADLNKQIDDNRKRASAGIAGVAAMANIPQVLEHQTFAIGAGAGNTDGESALAVGFSARASQNTVIKASVSNDTQHNFVVGVGASYGW